ncbi:hypothetical protein DAI22_09g113350 [Oryza sativa Japonica Group]|jgi:hypothetical protein|nr:hypothetical protein DAI22_09g113350 [Oryza sativa Japonica Group]
MLKVMGSWEMAGLLSAMPSLSIGHFIPSANGMGAFGALMPSSLSSSILSLSPPHHYLFFSERPKF